MNNQEKIQQIHESLINGQRKQMTEQINSYGLYDFFSDYRSYLGEIYMQSLDIGVFDSFADCVISYHQIISAMEDK